MSIWWIGISKTLFERYSRSSAFMWSWL